MERLDFPIITPDWTAREELSLLEGIETYGIGNWADVRPPAPPRPAPPHGCSLPARTQLAGAAGQQAGCYVRTRTAPVAYARLSVASVCNCSSGSRRKLICYQLHASAAGF